MMMGIRQALAAISLLIITVLSSVANAAPMDATVRLLREQRFIAEDLAYQIKSVFKPNSIEYIEALRLYNIARREYGRFLEDFTFMIAHAEVKSLSDSAARADKAGKEFQGFVSSKTKTLGAPLAGALALSDPITKAAEAISKEIRTWFEYNDKKRLGLIDDLNRLLAWKEWDKIK